MMVQIFKKDGYFDLKLIYGFFRAAKDGQYSVTMQRVRKVNTDEQKGYLWGCVYPLVLDALIDAGWDNITDCKQVHALCLDKFAKTKAINYQTGEIVEFPDSTAEMNTVEMMTYTDKIREWAREYLNTEIPDPDPNWRTRQEYSKQR